jgi:hypothetical protein
VEVVVLPGESDDIQRRPQRQHRRAPLFPGPTTAMASSAEPLDIRHRRR